MKALKIIQGRVPEVSTKVVADQQPERSVGCPAPIGAKLMALLCDNCKGKIWITSWFFYLWVLSFSAHITH